MGKVSIDTSWLACTEDMSMVEKVQFYGALVAFIIDGEVITPKGKDAAFAWRCVLPIIRKSQAVSKVRSAARLSATKREQNAETLSATKREQSCDKDEKVCCEQNDNKIELSGSVSDVISEKSHVVKHSFNDKLPSKSAMVEPLNSSNNNSSINISSDNISTSNKENKKEKESTKEKEQSQKVKYAEHVAMTEGEFAKLIDKYGKEQTIWMINKLNAYKGSKNKKYNSDYLAILNWVVGEYEKQTKNTGNGNKVNTRIHPGGTQQAPADYGNSTI